ncbi:uncharacterized protein LOC119681546 [Teleopsis dalmanni]|uniref:uncharacterized protein LOC119681546 n=1 Tax=Teleopsis dalmanni TaxID=139649 RepID=UPI0018CDC911|nr:uncharacterized protein LOC119681546 [Teleopsis dalmanni]
MFKKWVVLLLLLPLNMMWIKAEEEDDDSGIVDYTNLYRRNLHQMLTHRNPAIEPCDNFFQHACGGVQNGDPKTTSNEAAYDVPPFLYNAQDRMQFFKNTRGKFKTKAGLLLRNLYNACKNRSQIYKNKNGQWLRMISAVDFLADNAYIYRNFPFLSYQWLELTPNYTPNWVELAATMAAHGIPTLLNIFFAENTIYIAPLDIICPGFTTIRESLKPLMRSRNAQIKNIIAHEIHIFCRELTGKMNTDSEEILQNSQPSDEEENTSSEKTTSILIDETITTYFENFFYINLNFTKKEFESARKLPIDIERLSEILNIMRNADTRIMHNYLLWQAYEQLKYEDCFLLTEEFERILFSEYWEWHVFSPYFDRNVAIASFLLHTTRFQKYRRDTYMSGTWDKFLFKKLRRKDFNIERVIKHHVSKYLSPELVESVYVDNTTKTNSNNFYTNLLNLRKRQLRNTFFTHVIDTENLNHPAYFLQQFLFFCILMVHQPLFHYYATQSFDMWYNSNILYSSDGYYFALDCLVEQNTVQRIYENSQSEKVDFKSEAYDTNIDFDDSNNSLYNDLSAEEVKSIFQFYGAFVESYRDYQFWLEGETFAFAEDFVLEYYHINSISIMFYAVAQLYCGRNDAYYSTLINRSFMNALEFQVAFNCSTEAPMNPRVKCMIRNY